MTISRPVPSLRTPPIRLAKMATFSFWRLSFQPGMILSSTSCYNFSFETRLALTFAMVPNHLLDTYQLIHAIIKFMLAYISASSLISG